MWKKNPEENCEIQSLKQRCLQKLFFSAEWIFLFISPTRWEYGLHILDVLWGQKTFKCHPGNITIRLALKKFRNTVRKYVKGLKKTIDFNRVYNVYFEIREEANCQSDLYCSQNSRGGWIFILSNYRVLNQVRKSRVRNGTIPYGQIRLYSCDQNSRVDQKVKT